VTDDLKLAWAAGLFEGEGCVSVEKRNGGRRVGIRLAVTSTDEDVLRAFQEAVRCGKVYGPYARNKSRQSHQPHWKPKYHWVTNLAGDAYTLRDAFRPYLGQRRLARFTDVFEAYETQPDAISKDVAMRMALEARWKNREARPA
jgi:hypothetical protein